MNSIILSHSQVVSISVNCAIFALILIGAIVLISKIKLDDKGYKYLFILYTVFWIPLMLVRPYRGTMQIAVDGKDLLWIVMAAYGFVGIFLRAFADVINYLFKYRKAFLYFSLGFELILFIPILVIPNSTTNIIEAVGVGVGASCIGTYELLFKEQYNQKKSFLTVSILSIPPLLANFLTAPIQSVVKTAATVNEKVDAHTLLILWMIAFCFAVISLIMVFFLKEKKRTILELSNAKYDNLVQKNNARQKNQVFLFICLALVGMLIMFVKFSNSGAIGLMHVEQLAKLTGVSSAAYGGYLHVIFSLFQLVAGILVGTVLIKKWNVSYIFILGSGLWVVYELAAAFIENPIAYFCVHSINGFSYGILYNLVLAMVLKMSLVGKVVTKMGWYQSILAIGITAAGWFVPWVKQTLMKNNDTLQTYMHVYMIENLILLGCILFSIIFFLLIVYLFKREGISFTPNKETKKLAPVEAQNEQNKEQVKVNN